MTDIYRLKAVIFSPSAKKDVSPFFVQFYEGWQNHYPIDSAIHLSKNRSLYSIPSM